MDSPAERVPAHSARGRIGGRALSVVGSTSGCLQDAMLGVHHATMRTLREPAVEIV